MASISATGFSEVTKGILEILGAICQTPLEKTFLNKTAEHNVDFVPSYFYPLQNWFIKTSIIRFKYLKNFTKRRG